MLGLAMGTMPGRQVARDQKSAHRKNQLNEVCNACEENSAFAILVLPSAALNLCCPINERTESALSQR
ncbi:hypothetical protein AC629_04665 [Bradyrhizobium sp. NAS80.1]|nr:hypothetical protein AC629_04665 [Bradyrhizobium sp. NAS80.1]